MQKVETCKNRYYILLGKSSAGKDSLLNSVLKDKSIECEKLVLTTSREKRDYEVDGYDYFFKTCEQFQNLKAENKVIGCIKYTTNRGDWHYGIEMPENNGKTYITALGITHYQRFVEDLKLHNIEADVNVIYITVDDVTRITRSINRVANQADPNIAEICRRYLADEEDYSKEAIEKLNATTIYNKDLQTAKNEILNIIKNNH